MEYHSALRYLYNLVDYEKRRIERYSPEEFRLDRVVQFLEVLGNPHQRYPTVHIAGTKGKGSTSAMLASIAREGGLKVGLYTSPHLHTYRERMQINGEPISRSEITALIEELKPLVDARPELTMFEVTTAIAFLYFARQHVDLAVIEVGLGGRLDATNVITPLVSVITSLSLDHTYLLGNTLAEIATEKAGILKPGVPGVFAPQRPEALEILKDIAQERDVSYALVGDAWTWTSVSRSIEGQQLEVHSREASPLNNRYHIPLLGAFQQENAAVAIATADVLRRQGASWITPKIVQRGLEKINWPGRMEVLSRNPLLVVDCAHNPYSAETFRQSLEMWFPRHRWLLIYGASSDKDIPGMLNVLLPISEHVIVTRSYHPRATTPYALADICADLGKGAEIAINPERAIEQALTKLTPDMGILVTGSIFLVAEVRELRSKAGALTLPQGDWEDEPWKHDADTIK